ncbi:hypothetical protein, partial [Pontiella sp.]|uniref:hypothetical protein n=1 Tax=Pontiella sp. TaxID=2837462 RepID=UPI003566439A
MNKLAWATAGIVAATAVSGTYAGNKHPGRHRNTDKLFQHVSTFDVMAGNGSAVAEIVDASKDGTQLVYTDSDNEAIGFV